MKPSEITEIEASYNLTEQDHSKIKKYCEYIWNRVITDILYDISREKPELYRSWYKLRRRNWEWELKRKQVSQDNLKISLEFTDLEAIKQILQAEFGISIEDLEEFLTINVLRDEYKYRFKEELLHIYVDRHRYWEKYEIEMIHETKEHKKEPQQVIENFRRKLNLIAGPVDKSKTKKHLKEENKEAYERLKSFRK